ncbi:hypothetical protein SUGI_0898220 [Cryptomeria japonica]|uniref:transcription initiation factor IIB-1 n=1 Tax=Cryptomeria japonica TaxID=3369 RepID=UPI002414A498|nr:transcription initiation factor IIB-1 [Cryptomeria japonica]GLJ43261.1 hypothetical protein SUGI_0898220 [Cryptomeria japonica]
MGGHQVRKYCATCQADVEAEVDRSQGLVVCTECATVLEDQYIDDTQDVRIFEDNQDAQRVEPASGSHNPFSEVTNPKETAHLEEIARIASAVGPSCTAPVITQAQSIFTALLRSRPAALRGKYGVHLSAIYVACLYISGRQLNKLVTMAEFTSKFSDLRQSDVNKAWKFLRQKIPKACGVFLPDDPPPEKIDMNKFIDPHVRASVTRLCKALRFDHRQRRCAEEMSNDMVKNLHIRKKPASIAAAVAWICSLLFVRNSNDDVELIVKNSVGRGTLRQTYKLLLPHLPRFVNRDMFGDPHVWQKLMKTP